MAPPHRPRWFVIVPQLPRPERSSGDRRLFAMLQALATQCELTIGTVSVRDADAQAAEPALERLGVRIGGHGAREVIATLVRDTFEAVCFEFHHVATGLTHLVRALQPQALVVVDSVDLHYLREREAARISDGDPHALARAEAAELSSYRAADVTLVVTESERIALAGHGLTDVDVVPNIVPIIARTDRDRAPEVLFIGGFRHPPNGVAVHWFARDIWPRVRRAVPAATWTIVGSDVPDDVRALDGHDGIRVAGFVPDTMPFLDAAQVSVAPLTFGAGMKGKVSEALAAGVPVVTTRWGAQGLEDGAGSAFLLADDAPAFADAVIALLGDAALRDRLSQAAPLLAAQRCSADAAAPALARLVSRSAAPRRAPIGRAARVATLGVLVLRRRLARLTG